MSHDAFVTPVDVVKQRLQVYNSRYSGVFDAVRCIVRTEGFRAFYVSYPTTVIMNVPFMSVHFMAYEFLKETFETMAEESKMIDEHNPIVHLTAGAGAGALGGLVSNPFDVVKTRIQTASLPNEIRSMYGAFNYILKSEGMQGFTNGFSARMLYFAPSAAITWTTYEAMKRVLGW
mmetsp:Transcript_2800/g.5164  ORF Transcript_2800/g.5164 Transcript_2800/m.5164 type:complete len:175 (-) Transcript_2800:14-538(-)